MKNEIIEKAKKIAAAENTILKIKDYSEFGFTSITFSVDNFGGDYIHINLNNETLKMINWIGSTREKEVKIEELENLVKSEKAKEIAARKNIEYSNID